MDTLGVGYALHPDPECLELARPLLEEDVDYFEVNPETLWRPSPRGLEPNGYHALFREIQERSGRPFVAHGLAFSPGTDLLDTGESERTRAWLSRLRDDHATFGFPWMTEHLGWTVAGGLHTVLPIPLPCTWEAVTAVALRLRLLNGVVSTIGIENSANYFGGERPQLTAHFLNAIARATPCHLLLDLHNIHTEALNFDFDPMELVSGLDLTTVLQIHLSGGSMSEPEWLSSGRVYRLDSHDGPVPERVWRLFEHVAPRCPNLRGVVVERLNGTFDGTDLWDLREEVRRARRTLDTARTHAQSQDAPPPPLLPPGGDLLAVQHTLARGLTQADTGALESELPGDFGGGDPDGLRLTGLLVRKLRFERLGMGYSRIDPWFDADPQGFARVFEAYLREGPATAYFPEDEGRLFASWCNDRGIVPAGLPAKP